MEAAIIISVAPQAHLYRHGPLGTYIVPPMEEGRLGILVVREMGEIQDVGSHNSKRTEAIAARKIAEQIMLAGADSMVRRGLLICAAEPEVPRALERAERDERDYLNAHPFEIRSRLNPVTRMREASTVDDPDVKKEKQRLSEAVSGERAKFEAECRKLVKPGEIETAKKNRVTLLKELVQEADNLHAMGEKGRREINVTHKSAAEELGIEKPYAYSPEKRVDCPACGEKIKEGVAICAKCGAILDEEKARKFYPEKFREPAAAKAKA